jgi:hypothetical protein
MAFDGNMVMEGNNTVETEHGVSAGASRRKAVAALITFAASAAIALGVAASVHPGDSMGTAMRASGKFFSISGDNDACVSGDGLFCIDDNPDAGVTHNMKGGCCGKGFYTGDKGTFHAGKSCGQLGFNGAQKRGIWADDDTYAGKMCGGGPIGDIIAPLRPNCRGMEIFASCKQMLRLRCKPGVSPCDNLNDARKVEPPLPESCFNRKEGKEQCLEDDKCKWCSSSSGGSDSCNPRLYSQTGSSPQCTIDPNEARNQWGCVAGSVCGSSLPPWERHL